MQVVDLQKCAVLWVAMPCSVVAAGGPSRLHLQPDRQTSHVQVDGAYWIGVWLDPRASLDAVAKRKIPMSLEN